MSKLKLDLKKWQCPFCGAIGKAKWICTDDTQPLIKCSVCKQEFECDENGEPI
jgi:transcription elongation factor Elf1